MATERIDPQARRLVARDQASDTAPCLAETLIRLAARAGCLGRCMSVPLFRRMLGARGRVGAFRRLGARISSDVVLSHGVFMRTPSNVEIGSGSRLSGHVRIEAWDRVTIGRCCMFNDDILLLTAQHDIDDADFGAIVRPIEIGDYAWLPQRIVVLPGVRIGEGGVIGTGSVVTRDVPAYGVVAGNPARHIRDRRRNEFTYVPARW